MKTQFEKEINQILKGGRKELKKTGTIEPKAYIFGDNGKVNVLPLFPNNSIDKRLAIAHVRDKAKYHKAKRVVFISDSFTGPLDGIRPSLHPFRKEAILLISEDELGKHTMRQEYGRNSGDKIKLGKITVDRDNDFKGLFIEESFGVINSD